MGARVCSFYVKACCNRGSECPFRHEKPSTDELSKQSYHARYYGTDDPVANRMLARAEKIPDLKPPADVTVRTLFIGNITPTITVQDLQDVFCNYGELDSVKIFYIRGSGFVSYRSRQAAEEAVIHLRTHLIIKRNTLYIRWVKPNIKDNF